MQKFALVFLIWAIFTIAVEAAPLKRKDIRRLARSRPHKRHHNYDALTEAMEKYKTKLLQLKALKPSNEVLEKSPNVVHSSIDKGIYENFDHWPPQPFQTLTTNAPSYPGGFKFTEVVTPPANLVQHQFGNQLLNTINASYKNISNFSKNSRPSDNNSEQVDATISKVKETVNSVSSENVHNVPPTVLDKKPSSTINAFMQTLVVDAFGKLKILYPKLFDFKHPTVKLENIFHELLEKLRSKKYEHIPLEKLSIHFPNGDDDSFEILDETADTNGDKTIEFFKDFPAFKEFLKHKNKKPQQTSDGTSSPFGGFRLEGFPDDSLFFVDSSEESDYENGFFESSHTGPVDLQQPNTFVVPVDSKVESEELPIDVNLKRKLCMDKISGAMTFDTRNNFDLSEFWDCLDSVHAAQSTFTKTIFPSIETTTEKITTRHALAHIDADLWQLLERVLDKIKNIVKAKEHNGNSVEVENPKFEVSSEQVLGHLPELAKGETPTEEEIDRKTTTDSKTVQEKATTVSSGIDSDNLLAKEKELTGSLSHGKEAESSKKNESDQMKVGEKPKVEGHSALNSSLTEDLSKPAEEGTTDSGKEKADTTTINSLQVLEMNEGNPWGLLWDFSGESHEKKVESSKKKASDSLLAIEKPQKEGNTVEKLSLEDKSENVTEQVRKSPWNTLWRLDIRRGNFNDTETSTPAQVKTSTTATSAEGVHYAAIIPWHQLYTTIEDEKNKGPNIVFPYVSKTFLPAASEKDHEVVLKTDSEPAKLLPEYQISDSSESTDDKSIEFDLLTLEQDHNYNEVEWSDEETAESQEKFSDLLVKVHGNKVNLYVANNERQRRSFVSSVNTKNSKVRLPNSIEQKSVKQESLEAKHIVYQTSQVERVLNNSSSEEENSEESQENVVQVIESNENNTVELQTKDSLKNNSRTKRSSENFESKISDSEQLIKELKKSRNSKVTLLDSVEQKLPEKEYPNNETFTKESSGESQESLKPTESESTTHKVKTDSSSEEDISKESEDKLDEVTKSYVSENTTSQMVQIQSLLAEAQTKTAPSENIARKKQSSVSLEKELQEQKPAKKESSEEGSLEESHENVVEVTESNDPENTTPKIVQSSLAETQTKAAPSEKSARKKRSSVSLENEIKKQKPAKKESSEESQENVVEVTEPNDPENTTPKIDESLLAKAQTKTASSENIARKKQSSVSLENKLKEKKPAKKESSEERSSEESQENFVEVTEPNVLENTPPKIVQSLLAEAQTKAAPFEKNARKKRSSVSLEKELKEQNPAKKESSEEGSSEESQENVVEVTEPNVSENTPQIVQSLLAEELTKAVNARQIRAAASFGNKFSKKQSSEEESSEVSQEDVDKVTEHTTSHIVEAPSKVSSSSQIIVGTTQTPLYVSNQLDSSTSLLEKFAENLKTSVEKVVEKHALSRKKRGVDYSSSSEEDDSPPGAQFDLDSSEETIVSSKDLAKSKDKSKCPSDSTETHDLDPKIRYPALQEKAMIMVIAVEKGEETHPKAEKTDLNKLEGGENLKQNSKPLENLTVKEKKIKNLIDLLFGHAISPEVESTTPKTIDTELELTDEVTTTESSTEVVATSPETLDTEFTEVTDNELIDSTTESEHFTVQPKETAQKKITNVIDLLLGHKTKDSEFTEVTETTTELPTTDILIDPRLDNSVEQNTSERIEAETFAPNLDFVDDNLRSLSDPLLQTVANNDETTEISTDFSDLTTTESTDNANWSRVESQFDEIAILQLIPLIIEQLRDAQVTPTDQEMLEQTYGDLWPLITDEATRKTNEPVNALLKSLLLSNEVRFSKRDITESITNDVRNNEIQQVYQPKARSKMRIVFDEQQQSPAERILKMAAAIIHKFEVQKESRRTKSRVNGKRFRHMAKQAFEDLVPSPSAVRVKRHSESGFKLLSNIIRSIKSKHERLRKALTVDEPQPSEEMVDIRRKKRFTVINDTPKPSLGFMVALVNGINRVAAELDNDDEGISYHNIKSSFPLNNIENIDYFEDYAFDEGVPDEYEDDYEYVNVGKPSKYYHNDLENPSITELINLAEVHRMRREKFEPEYVTDQAVTGKEVAN